jgi:hypothetical protein
MNAFRKSTLTLVVCSLLFFGCGKDDDANNGGNNNTNKCANSCNINPAIDPIYHGVVHSNLPGTYALTYAEVQSGAPFTDGSSATFVIGANGSMNVEYNGQCVFIDKSLIDVNTPVEIRFLDNCVFNVWFLLSDNEHGVFNEINVLNSAQQFMGQFSR